LDASSESVESNPVRREQEQWMRAAIASRLTAIAVDERDPELARFVLEQGSNLGDQRDAAQELMDLATSSESGQHVQGRTLGLVLATNTEDQRLRSSEVAAAVAATLGLPRAASGPDAVRLVFAQDEGGPGGATAAFQSLGLQGAAVVIAGFDSVTAEHHSWQAERVGIPTVLLHPHQLETPMWSYTLGVSPEHERALLEAEMRARGLFASRLVETDADACQPDTARAVQAQVRSWAVGGSDSVLFLGTRACAEAVLAANAKAKRPLPIGLGLRAGAAAGRSDPRVIALAPGAYPFEAKDAALKSWLERNGTTPSWFQSLGHDAAVLARAALKRLPETNHKGRSEVSAQLNAVRASLLHVGQVPLWTSDSSRFDPELVIERQFEFTGSDDAAEAP
jgi:hypothetical protein